jgi:hypothetical protein
MPKICECCGQVIKKDTRTSQQNKSLWLYFTLLAEEFNKAGLDLREVLRKDVMVEWNKNSIHDYLWLPIQKALTQKSSTTELDKLEEITKIYDTLNRHIGEKFGIYVGFPSEENQELE